MMLAESKISKSFLASGKDGIIMIHHSADTLVSARIIYTFNILSIRSLSGRLREGSGTEWVLG